jgi:ABC-2 type transport system permease protein
MFPLLFSSCLVHSPNGLVAMALSLFPFTSPSAMITRLVAIQVPIWQTLVSLGGLLVATGFCVVLSARFFRADALLSHSTINWQRILIALQRKSVDS